MPDGFLPAFCPYECGTTFPIEDPGIDFQGRRRSNRDLATLVRWVANSFVLQVPHDCPRRRATVPLFTSWSAIDALCSFLRRHDRRINRARMETLLEGWADEAEHFSRFLGAAAGSGGSRFARHLRHAGTVMANDAQLIREARAILSGGGSSGKRRQDAVGKLSEVEGGIELARGFLLAPVLERMELPSAVRTVLIESEAMPLEGIAEREVVYLARTGTAPFRVIAAHRLAGADSRQATATLKQLLFDSDATVALVALNSLMLRGFDATAIPESVFAALSDGISPTSSLVAAAIELRMDERRPQLLNRRQ